MKRYEYTAAALVGLVTSIMNSLSFSFYICFLNSYVKHEQVHTLNQ